MCNDAPWYADIALPAMLRPARTTYGLAMHRALAEIGCDDVPRNGLWVIGGLARGADSIPLGELVRVFARLQAGGGATGRYAGAARLSGAHGGCRRPPQADRQPDGAGQGGGSGTEGGGRMHRCELLARVGADKIAHARETLAALMVIGRERDRRKKSRAMTGIYIGVGGWVL